MKKNVDDDTLEMTDWPFLLPDDFDPCCLLIILVFFFPGIESSLVPDRFLGPYHTPCRYQHGHEAKALVDEGHLHALVDDFSTLESYWEGMGKDLPQHPIASDSRCWKTSLGCTLYCCWALLKKCIFSGGWFPRLLYL